MAKRKIQPGSITAFKIEPETDYRTDKYVVYYMQIETGFLQASVIDESLTDNDVDLFLKTLIKRLKDAEYLPKLLSTSTFETEQTVIDYGDIEKEALLLPLLLNNLQFAFEKYGTLEAKDIIGIAKSIRSSIKFWGSRGPNRRGYLTYLAGFLGQMGISTRQLTEDEIKERGLLTDSDPGDE